jgi:multidrug efflux pump subunit AcrA (membrane-fusion protein)
MARRIAASRASAPVLLLAALLAAACGGKEAASAAPVVTVDVAPVLSARIQRTIRADALLYPVQQAAIVPKITAPVAKTLVDRGAHVRAGQLLLELENKDLADAERESQAAFDAAEATYETTARATVPQEAQKAELDLRSAKDSLDAQQAIFDSRQALFKEGAIAQKDVNEAQVNLSQARTQYEVAQRHLSDLQGFAQAQSLKAAAAQRDQARAHLDAAEAQLSYSRITSPIDGVVTDRPVFAGETAPSGAPVVTVMDVSRVVARAHISQAEAAELKTGDAASIIGPDNVPVEGKVTQISPALDSTSTTVEVWVEAPNADGKLKPGTSVRTEMVARSVDSAFVVPQSALLTSAAGTTSVILIDADNTPHKQSVDTGIRDSGRVQITDGVKSGDRVATTGAFELAKLDPDVLEKTKVKIAPPKEAPDED